MSEILKSNDEPKTEIKKKRVLTEKQLESLRKGREASLLLRRQRKLERENMNNKTNVIEQPQQEEHVSNDTDSEPEAEPLLKQSKKKTIDKNDAYEQKKMLLEQKKLELEELKLNNLIDEENNKISKQKTKPINQNDRLEPITPTRHRGIFQPKKIMEITYD